MSMMIEACCDCGFRADGLRWGPGARGVKDARGRLRLEPYGPDRASALCRACRSLFSADWRAQPPTCPACVTPATFLNHPSVYAVPSPPPILFSANEWERAFRPDKLLFALAFACPSCGSMSLRVRASELGCYG